MSIFLRNYQIMQKNAAVLTAVCVMLCLTFNYTFPLHRESAKWSLLRISGNRTQVCEKPTSESSVVERNKKGATDLEGAFKKIKDSTQDLTKNIYNHISSGVKCSPDKNVLNEHDQRQYEQLVMMKKYPYLDLNELELNMKYSPSSNKNVRQSAKFHSGSSFANDPSICEPVDEAPNVEIINRGLSGFAIPAKLKNLKNYDETTKNTKLTKKSSEQAVINSLKNDVKQYVENL